MNENEEEVIKKKGMNAGGDIFALVSSEPICCWERIVSDNLVVTVSNWSQTDSRYLCRDDRNVQRLYTDLSLTFILRDTSSQTMNSASFFTTVPPACRCHTCLHAQVYSLHAASRAPSLSLVSDERIREQTHVKRLSLCDTP